jgi:hypothetical protein
MRHNRQMRSLFVVLALTAVVEAKPTRKDIATTEGPDDLLIVGKDLYYTDNAGGVFVMPTDGSTPAKELSNQHQGIYAESIVQVGTTILVTLMKGIAKVDGPQGPVKALTVDGYQQAEEVFVDDKYVYMTQFQKNDIVRYPVAGGKLEKITTAKSGLIAVRGDTLFVATYYGGTLVSLPKAGGKTKAIAKGLAKPTAFAVDDKYAFVYSEDKGAVIRVELANGKQTVIAKDLNNSDKVTIDGEWIYVVDWGEKKHSFLRFKKDGTKKEILADDLESPHALAVTNDALYLVSKGQNKIVKFDKSSL